METLAKVNLFCVRVWLKLYTKGSTDYSYDGNGNLIIDNNKLIDKITYNYLNLPTLVHLNTKGNIQYVYDAAGN
jgi:hypothetical protein